MCWSQAFPLKLSVIFEMCTLPKMYQQKKILAIIPARGGSKGVPRKNIRHLLGKPLIQWSIESAKKSRYIDRVIVSSEDAEIIQIAREGGCEVPFIRPIELAEDETTGVDVIVHALNTLTEKYDYVVVLQPTSPLRTTEDIDAAIQQMIVQHADFCVSVTTPEKHPYWSFSLTPNNCLQAAFPEIPSRRQLLPEMVTLNGAIYIAKVTAFLTQKTFLTVATQAYQMPKERSFDIDTELDFRLCEYMAQLLSKGEL